MADPYDDERYRAYMNEQEEARLEDYLSGDPAAFTRHLARIRQRADASFEHRAPDGTWLLYVPGGYPYGAREVEALRARGVAITQDNVLVRYPRGAMPTDAGDAMNERGSQSTSRRLTATQERVLLHLYRTGALPPRCRADTLRVLIIAGMIVLENQHDFVVTAQGKAYCQTHVLDLRPFWQPSGDS